MLIGIARGITFIMQAIIFRIVPTALEISLVCGILVRCTVRVRMTRCTLKDFP